MIVLFLDRPKRSVCFPLWPHTFPFWHCFPLIALCNKAKVKVWYYIFLCRVPVKCIKCQSFTVVVYKIVLKTHSSQHVKSFASSNNHYGSMLIPYLFRMIHDLPSILLLKLYEVHLTHSFLHTSEYFLSSCCCMVFASAIAQTTKFTCCVCHFTCYKSNQGMLRPKKCRIRYTY